MCPCFTWLSCLHRTCLQLITDCPVVIQDELDLISALSQLEDFGVSILPLQGMTKNVSFLVEVLSFNNKHAYIPESVVYAFNPQFLIQTQTRWGCRDVIPPPLVPAYRATCLPSLLSLPPSLHMSHFLAIISKYMVIYGSTVEQTTSAWWPN